MTEPFIEMHSGPGRGYPVIYVVGRDDSITVLYSRTEWYKVRAPRGQEGWVRRADLARTQLPSGEPAPIRLTPNSRRHRWEVGAGYGVFNRQNLVTGFTDFGLTDSLDAEFVMQQAFGTIDNRDVDDPRPASHLHSRMALVFAHGRHRHRLSSTSTTKCRPTPLEIQQSDGLCVAGRARLHHPALHVARRLAQLRRLQQRQNQNEELEEWKFGLAVFF